MTAASKLRRTSDAHRQAMTSVTWTALDTGVNSRACLLRGVAVHDLTQGSTFRHLLRLALPIAIGMVFQTLYVLVDLYFVAQLGDKIGRASCRERVCQYV